MLRDRAARGRLAAGSWTLGGFLWAVHAVVLNTRPEGCIASACSVSPSPARPTEDLLWLFLVSVASLAIGMILAPTSADRGRTLRRIGTGLVLVGVTVLSLGLIINAALPGDSPLWWLHDSDGLGRFLPVLGSLAAGIAALRGHWLGRWQSALLVPSALASFGFNAQTDRILFTVPLGAAWAGIGLLGLLSEAAGRRD